MTLVREDMTASPAATASPIRETGQLEAPHRDMWRIRRFAGAVREVCYRN